MCAAPYLLGTTTMGPRIEDRVLIDRQVRPAWVPARSAKQVIASNFTVDAHGHYQSLMRFGLDADKPG
jgi:mannose/fructose/N-acetylgalactosamine-specific phosphotransferase system component IIB